MDNIELLELEIANTVGAVANEQVYFDFHRKRYRRFDQFLEKTIPDSKAELKVLNIGSHYLHTSILLAQRGYQVDAMDVAEFWDMDFVQARGRKFGLNPIVNNDISRMEAFVNVVDHYDLVVFTEIMEHITFNPILFWKRIYQILKPSGMIYISTPNAFALPNYIRNLKNTLLMKSIGITVDDILSKVTYGHHWKEYSPREIKTYFQRLSPDFEVQIHPYHYVTHELKPPYFVFKLLSRIGNTTKIFADDLEVIVSLKQKAYWSIKEPEY
ncbi:methyltransferase domain-containing protein [Algoriphagus aestuariicola]|uniref:Methyltransferase domain-containing protein n=1 Tax=Algoriphagus aestuariicola TaxID=1852016 RepID=A0ABS3BTT8_9BACT|nr:methyltransferase domain-containing protein [Algoriphagus aestuariicola]MBN7802475.1 methyltransferase domain-containing protein [Algoriphagus aestuariicola]